MGKVKFIETSISEVIAKLVSKQDHRIVVRWATDCSEHVLPYFEEKHPIDYRQQYQGT